MTDKVQIILEILSSTLLFLFIFQVFSGIFNFGWIYFGTDGYKICEENLIENYELSKAWSNPLSMNKLVCWYVTEGDRCMMEFERTKKLGVIKIWDSCD